MDTVTLDVLRIQFRLAGLKLWKSLPNSVRSVKLLTSHSGQNLTPLFQLAYSDLSHFKLASPMDSDFLLRFYSNRPSTDVLDSVYGF